MAGLVRLFGLKGPCVLTRNRVKLLLSLGHCIIIDAERGLGASLLAWSVGAW